MSITNVSGLPRLKPKDWNDCENMRMLAGSINHLICIPSTVQVQTKQIIIITLYISIILPRLRLDFQIEKRRWKRAFCFAVSWVYVSW